MFVRLIHAMDHKGNNSFIDDLDEISEHRTIAPHNFNNYINSRHALQVDTYFLPLKMI